LILKYIILFIIKRMSDLDEIPSMASSIVDIADADIVDADIVDADVDAEVDADVDDAEADDAEADADDAEVDDDIDDDIDNDDEDIDDDIDDDDDDDGATNIDVIDDEDNTIKKVKKNKKKVIVVDSEEFLGTSINGPETIETTAEDYNSDEDEHEAEDFQKIDDEMRKNYILMNHPESTTQNYDEIYRLSKIVRNKSHIIVDSAHRTLPMLTKYEKARILGVRAKQLNNGSVPFIELKENIIDGYLIAERELAEKKIPFIIRRPLPNRGSEYWRLEDLEII